LNIGKAHVESSHIFIKLVFPVCRNLAEDLWIVDFSHFLLKTLKMSGDELISKFIFLRSYCTSLSNQRDTTSFDSSNRRSAFTLSVAFAANSFSAFTIAIYEVSYKVWDQNSRFFET
jgi:hypothetical protein